MSIKDGKTVNVLMVGVGGQGIILSSNILSRAAMLEGYDVKKSEIHGMSQRGGSVFSHVRYGAEVFSPVIPQGEADIILSLEKLETVRWASHGRADALAVYMRTELLPSNVDVYPAGVDDEIKRLFSRVIDIDPEDFKARVGNPKTFNVALLGVLSRHLSLGEESFMKAIAEFAPQKALEMNFAAFKAGEALAVERNIL